MGATTGIQWTDHTFNPWWGCAHVSPGCVHCYAETLAKRCGNDVWGTKSPRRFFGEKHWAEPRKWNREAEARGKPERVFCASMADVGEPREDLKPWREKLWRLIAETPWLDWQLLTKRPEMVYMAPWSYGKWPANVWVGTSVENQEWADKRIPILCQIPAAIRFLSCEPLVGPVFLEPDHLAAVDWVIVGGESGPGARKMDLEWARVLVEQCCEVNVPVFVKQLGAAYRTEGDSHGAAMELWPTELQIRQMPKSVVR
jgi:protein gp37